jgi:hypothetical protein
MAKKKPLDYDSLDPDQQNIADKVFLAAEKYGLNPDFVLPLVYAESGFKHVKQINGPAFGVMQLEPDTAKSMKCDPTNLDENIDCGMKLIKSHVDNPRIGNDPYKNIIAYNTRSDTLNKFLDAYDTDPEHPEKHLHLLPDRTQTHIANIMDFHGGDLPSATFGGKLQTESTQASEETSDSQAETADHSNEGHGKPRPKPEERPINPLVGGVLGATVGASLGYPIGQYKTYYDLAKSATGMLPRVDPTMGVEPPIETNEGAWGKKTGYGIGEGSTREQSQRYQRTMPKGKLARAYAERLGGTSTMREAAAQAQAEAQALAEAKALALQQAARTQGPIRSSLGQITKNFLIPLQGAMAGFGAGFGGLDAYNRARAGDTSGSVAAGIGGVASALAPFVPYAGGLSMAIPAGLAIRDVYRNSYLPVSSREEQARLAREYPDNTGNPMAQP